MQFAGEYGSDSGAMAKELLTTAIDGMQQELFPGGIPVDSMLNVHNGTFFTAGQIAAISVVQGGLPPAVFDESTYNMIVKPEEVNLNQLTDDYFTLKDNELLEQIRIDPVANQDVIIDHGYNGIIDVEHTADIIGTVRVSLVSKRLVYLKEFKKGLNLFGLSKGLKDNVEMGKKLFVCQTNTVNANYVVSILCAQFSEQGSSRRPKEEAIFDNLQDFVMSTEDESITGSAEEVAWNDKDDADFDNDECPHVQSPDLTPGGILGWLTGQKHQPLDGQRLSVSVKFDHECLTRDPKHTICFPLVGACAQVITFPVCHMVDPDESKRIMLLAFCKGQAFSIK